MDRVAIGIKGAEQPALVKPHAGRNALERILGHEKNSLHRAIVPPEPHGTPGRVIKTVWIREMQRHRGMPSCKLNAEHQLGFAGRSLMFSFSEAGSAAA